MARRDRAHDIGEREERRLAGLAIERGDEAVVAIFGVNGFEVALQPGERVERAAVEQSGIVDLEPRREPVDDEQPRVTRLAPP